MEKAMDTLLMQNKNKAELYLDQVNNAARYFTDAYYKELQNDQLRTGSITEGKSSIDMKLCIKLLSNM